MSCHSRTPPRFSTLLTSYHELLYKSRRRRGGDQKKRHRSRVDGCRTKSDFCPSQASRREQTCEYGSGGSTARSSLSCQNTRTSNTVLLKNSKEKKCTLRLLVLPTWQIYNECFHRKSASVAIQVECLFMEHTIRLAKHAKNWNETKHKLDLWRRVVEFACSTFGLVRNRQRVSESSPHTCS